MAFSKTEVVHELTWRKCKNDFRYFARNYWHIQHPEKGAMLFDLFDAQERAITTFEDNRNVITLKARQIGWTTLVAAYCFWETFFYPDRLEIFLSKGEREASAILQKVGYGYKRLPEWMRKRGPRTLRDNQSMLEFDNGSSIESLPSKSDPARGRSCFRVVVDEWAFLENPEEAWGSIEPITDVGGRCIGLSTANGWGNFFHTMWVGAETETGTGSSFTTIFEPWSARDDRDADWYASKQASLPSWQLHQEYPTTPEEAFIKSGNPVFDVEKLAAIETEEPEQGILMSKDYVTFVEQDGGAFRMWERPIAADSYVIGADVAEGLGHGDYSSAHVIHWRTHKVVATWHGHIDAAEFAEKLADLGRYYNMALIGVENNNHGLTTCKYLKDWHKYPHLFYSRIEDERSKRVTNKIGWTTTKKTRPLLINDIAEELRDGSLVVLDKLTIAELRTFVRDEIGKMHGSPFDDRVFSLGIAIQMLNYASQFHRAQGHTEWGTLDFWEGTLREQRAPVPMAIGAHNTR